MQLSCLGAGQGLGVGEVRHEFTLPFSDNLVTRSTLYVQLIGAIIQRILRFTEFGTFPLNNRLRMYFPEGDRRAPFPFPLDTVSVE